MPANYILINEKLEYSVGDSKMDELLKWLKENAHKAKVQLNLKVAK